MKTAINALSVRNDNIIKVENFQNTDTPVTLKTESFSIKMMFAFLRRKAEKILKNKEAVRSLATNVLSYMKKLGNISFLKKWFVDVPTLCDMLIDVINGTYKNFPHSSLVTIIIGIIYILNPMDFLVDSFPVLGVADDAMILKIVLDTVKNDMESYKSWKESQVVA